MAKPVVLLVPHTRQLTRLFAPEDLARLHDLAEVVWGRDEPMPAADFLAALPEAVAVVHGMWPYGGATTLQLAPRLRAVIELMGAHGHPGFDYDYCFDHRIRVLSCSPAFAPQVAEMALGLTLAAARGIPRADRLFRAGQELYSSAGNAESFLLAGQTVGFIGFGAIARQLQALLAPFSCRLLAYDPWQSPSRLRAEGVEPASLDEVLAARVVYVLAIPTADNRALLDRARLEQLRPESVLVLISRAHLVDFDALTELVLQSRFRAAIDVFPEEPLSADHPIRGAEGAILSAHRAGSTLAGLRQIGRWVVDDLEALLAGQPPHFLLAAQPEFIARLDAGGQRVSASYKK